jgi:hypothetical protein
MYLSVLILYISYIQHFCSVYSYSCCHVTIARKNMRCLVTAGKHVSNTRVIARQMLGKRVLAATDSHATVEVLLD